MAKNLIEKGGGNPPLHVFLAGSAEEAIVLRDVLGGPIAIHARGTGGLSGPLQGGNAGSDDGTGAIEGLLVSSKLPSTTSPLLPMTASKGAMMIEYAVASPATPPMRQKAHPGTPSPNPTLPVVAPSSDAMKIKIRMKLGIRRRHPNSRRIPEYDWKKGWLTTW